MPKQIRATPPNHRQLSVGQPAALLPLHDNSATTETSQQQLKPVQAKHPHCVCGGHATPPTPNPRTDSVTTSLLERKLNNHPDKALLSGLLMTSAMAASISKHPYAKCQLNLFEFNWHLSLMCTQISNSMACCMPKLRIVLGVLQYYLVYSLLVNCFNCRNGYLLIFLCKIHPPESSKNISHLVSNGFAGSILMDSILTFDGDAK